MSTRSRQKFFTGEEDWVNDTPIRKDLCSASTLHPHNVTDENAIEEVLDSDSVVSVEKGISHHVSVKKIFPGLLEGFTHMFKHCLLTVLAQIECMHS